MRSEAGGRQARAQGRDACNEPSCATAPVCAVSVAQLLRRTVARWGGAQRPPERGMTCALPRCARLRHTPLCAPGIMPSFQRHKRHEADDAYPEPRLDARIGAMSARARRRGVPPGAVEGRAACRAVPRAADGALAGALLQRGTAGACSWLRGRPAGLDPVRGTGTTSGCWPHRVCVTWPNMAPRWWCRRGDVAPLPLFARAPQPFPPLSPTSQPRKWPACPCA